MRLALSRCVSERLALSKLACFKSDLERLAPFRLASCNWDPKSEILQLSTP